jgi:hypothetical protein
MGLNSFDIRTLIGYFANRKVFVKPKIIANTFAKAKDFVAEIAQAFQPRVLATVAA